MNKCAPAALMGVFFLLGGSAAGAQLSDTQPAAPPPAAIDDEAKEMRQTHAPDGALERPAASQNFRPPMMQGMDTDMNDAGVQHMVWLENLEGVHAAKNAGAWDAQARWGGDFDRLWIKTEGTTLGGKTQDARAETFWAHAILPFWDTQLGVRHDFSGGPSREWAAFGVQGIAPYWLDVELAGYVGQMGRTALRLKTEYDLHLTQRLVLKPEIELNAYGRADRERAIGAGLSDGRFAMRLRYEFTRRFAPYLGYLYQRKFAGSATLARQSGDPPIDHRAVAGIQSFF